MDNMESTRKYSSYQTVIALTNSEYIPPPLPPEARHELGFWENPASKSASDQGNGNPDISATGSKCDRFSPSEQCAR